jgi:hypothetical protein
MSEYAVKLDDLASFIKEQLKLEEACAMAHKNLVSGVELDAYYRAMEDIQIAADKMKFELKPKKTRKKKDDKIS